MMKSYQDFTILADSSLAIDFFEQGRDMNVCPSTKHSYIKAIKFLLLESITPLLDFKEYSGCFQDKI